MDDKLVEAVASHRWAVIAEAANARLTPAERGLAVPAIAARTHAHPDGSERCYSRGTIDRWVRDWRTAGLAGLRPKPRATDSGAVRARPELFDEAVALRLELPSRSATQIAEILWARHNVRVAPRTLRAQLRRRGLHREALEAEPKVFRPLRGVETERAVDHRRARRPVGPVPSVGRRHRFAAGCS